MTIVNLIISGLYIGYIKFAPGSISSLIFLIIYFFIPNIYLYQISLLIFLLIIGFYSCYIFSRNSLDKDPPFIVIDEITGMYISIFMLPKSIFLYSIAFILFRFFDICKPSIINKSQKLGNGLGIMLDDIISGIFALVICWSIYLW